MLKLRKSSERGKTNLNWLKSFHTFSFGDYYDPRFSNLRSLRVINEDFVAPAGGFAPHGHADMEILTYVVEGALEHKDSMGNGTVIQAGDVQLMGAGRGVTHSEFNHSKEAPVHFLQIWVNPGVRGTLPRYAQSHFDRELKLNKFCFIAGIGHPDISIEQDIKVFASVLTASQAGVGMLDYAFEPGREGFIHLITGTLVVKSASNANGEVKHDTITANAGDGIFISAGTQAFTVEAQEKDAHFLFFDLR